ncbi:MAG: GNAT family N-acetyltransferase [Woeseiaceae bacterium]
MKLLPLDSAVLLERVAGWLARPENYHWLDFGSGRQIVTPALLKIMQQQDTHFLRAYTGDDDEVPVGIVGLNNVNHVFRTATLWGATGEKAFRNRGYATYAASKFLTLAFEELGLHAINTWAVEHNPSVRVMQRLNFTLVGRQRQCHRMGGRVNDRLYFDLLASEHRELELPERSRIRRSGADLAAAS